MKLNDKKHHLDKKGGDPEGLLVTEMMRLPLWKLQIIECLLCLHLNILVKYYLKH